MKTILIADDEEAVRALIAATLVDSSKYRVLMAVDGEEALRLVREEKPDLLLLDIMMPKKNGYEVCQELKENQSTKDIKVVMLTALAGSIGRQKALGLGADEYFTKPFSPMKLLQVVERMIE
ncbi:MAG: response regulator [Dehalococcoidia bacterium]